MQDPQTVKKRLTRYLHKRDSGLRKRVRRRVQGLRMHVHVG
jgi:hypothetical protein